MQLPDRLENIKAMIDDIKPAVIKDSKVTKDSGLIIAAFVGLVLGVIFGIMIGVTLYSIKIVASLIIFLSINCIIGFFKNHYLHTKNSRKVETIDTLLYTELVTCIPVLVITVLPAIF